jgi:hypothetical protein
MPDKLETNPPPKNEVGERNTVRSYLGQELAEPEVHNFTRRNVMEEDCEERRKPESPRITEGKKPEDKESRVGPSLILTVIRGNTCAVTCSCPLGAFAAPVH